MAEVSFSISAEAALLMAQANWSRSTFGPGPRTEGVLDHIAKESKEIREDPMDIEEWIDIVILALDGAWRAVETAKGERLTMTDAQRIFDTLNAKRIKNEKRTWPDWRTAEPGKAIEHDRSQDQCDGTCHDRREDDCAKCGSGNDALWCDDCRHYAVQDGTVTL